MTARLLLSCDGTRHGQPCRGAWSTPINRHGGVFPAVLVAREQGWTTDGQHHRCPSGGHDDDGPPP